MCCHSTRGVHLCLRIYPGLRKSCWSVCLELKELELLNIPLPVRKCSLGDSGAEENGSYGNSAEVGLCSKSSSASRRRL